MKEETVRLLYQQITKKLIEKKITITTMESATSGQIASLITDTEGASAIMKGAFITYSNEAKIKMGVPAGTIEDYGVYSRETALAMAHACKEAYQADIGIGITGSFGNVDPANADSVPGSVYYAIVTKDHVTVSHERLAPCDSRLAYKLKMAQIIGLELMKELKS